MPEGNEIHRWAELHAAMFRGKRVRVDSPQGRFLDAELLDGQRISGVLAVGKHLGYDFGIIAGERRILHVHMGLYGDFVEGKQPMPAPRGALRLRIWDRFHWLELRGPTDCSLWTQADWEALLIRLGPDPLLMRTSLRMAERIVVRSTFIGALLMDQSVVSGIGNIYRAELLFRAGVSPFLPGRDVPAAVLDGIWKDARLLMRHGMGDRRIVTTRAKHRPHPRGDALDEEVHYVYRRHGRRCFLCGGKIATEVLAGRNLFWCPKCQPG